MVTIYFPWIIKNRTLFACYRPTFTFNLCYNEAEPSLLFILEGGTVLTSIFLSSSIGNWILCLFTLLVTDGPLTCCMWTSSKKTICVDVRYGSGSFLYQYSSCLISTSSLSEIMNNMEKMKWVELLSLFTCLSLILNLFFLLWKYVEHDQPLLYLSIHCLFPLTLILCTLLYFLNFLF